MQHSTTSSSRVLIVDGESAVRDDLVRMLNSNGIAATGLELGREAMNRLRSDPTFDLVFVDLDLADVDALELIREARSGGRPIPVVAMTANPTPSDAVNVLRLGALDFLAKPCSPTKFLDRVRSVVGRRGQPARAIAGESGTSGLVGRSEIWLRAVANLNAAARTRSTVLIMGESGTGKELVARAIHDRSDRRGAPFLSINCGAFTESLLESELFGHVKGAFTGATTNFRGLFASASGGTIFLDEIGEIPLEAQVRLLRTLQEGTIRPVGASHEVPVDVRVIAATNRNLAELVRDGRFRKDLYFRLNVLVLKLPPLRERIEDIPLLVEHFADKHSSVQGKMQPFFDGAFIERLAKHDWPGNIRELENFVERCVAFARDGRIPTDAMMETRESEPRLDRAALAQPLPVAIRAFQRRYLEELLKRAGGNLSAAARHAGVDRSNLRRLVTACEVRRSTPPKGRSKADDVSGKSEPTESQP